MPRLGVNISIGWANNLDWVTKNPKRENKRKGKRKRKRKREKISWKLEFGQIDWLNLDFGRV